nr:MAG TPA_asm: hypothetical protein [Caudoviricetes sp.]
MYNRQHTCCIYKPLQSCRHWPELDSGEVLGPLIMRVSSFCLFPLLQFKL